MPMGIPGCPEPARCTASMARARMAEVSWVKTGGLKSLKVDIGSFLDAWSSGNQGAWAAMCPSFQNADASASVTSLAVTAAREMDHAGTWRSGGEFRRLDLEMLEQVVEGL